ncbi:MAG: sel1 repeat family protein, partial [Victivallales bacterium]|nr:sel1 repeat family protein [Victivallales bacterium]
MKTGWNLCILLLSLTLAVECAGKTKKQNNKVSLSGTWALINDVKKLYNTNFGAVYHFTPCEKFAFSITGRHNRTGTNMPKVNALLFSAYNDENDYQKKARRFHVLDFYIRVFPAEDKAKNPHMFFSLFSSNLPIADINRYSDFSVSSQFPGDSTCWNAYSAINTNYINPVLNPWSKSISGGLKYTPHYEPISCRIIYDTEKGTSATCINGSVKHVDLKKYKFFWKYPFYTFGICIESPRIYQTDNIRTVLEISDPVLTLVNSKDALKELPPLKPQPYPYNQLTSNVKKGKKNKNPDATYAYALELLEQGDWDEAKKQLERAEHSRHIFAMYQLGVCHYRGVGTEQNMAKSVRYLSEAASFGHPDAMALYGLIQLKHSVGPQLAPLYKSRLKQALNAFDFSYGKHDNHVLGRMFINHKVLYPGGCTTSPKLITWAASDTLARWYYTLNLPPELIAESEKQAQSNVSIDKSDPFNIKYKWETSTKDIDYNKFYDKRSMFYPFQSKMEYDESCLMDAVKQNFTPAMLYYGRLLVNLPRLLKKFPGLRKDSPLSPFICDKDWAEKDYLKEALKLFKQGAELGDLQCETETLYCMAQLGELKPDDFTPALDLRLADYPVYYMLKHSISNPDYPGAKEFLSRDYTAARKIWAAHSNPWNDFMLGAELLYQFFNYGFDTAYYRIYKEDAKDIFTAYTLLDKAAAQGISPALYLCGKQYIDGKRHTGKTLSNKGINNYVAIRKGFELIDK